MSFHPLDRTLQDHCAKMTAHCLRRMRVRHHFHIRKAGYGPIQAGGLAVSKMFSKTRIEIGNEVLIPTPKNTARSV